MGADERNRLYKQWNKAVQRTLNWTTDESPST